MSEGAVGGRSPRHVLAVSAGNALEFYDFTTYAFFAVQIGHALFPARTAFENLMLSLLTFGVGFASRPLGGIVIGIYGDRAGRKPAILLSFALMGVSILGLALVPSYAQIGVAAPILAVAARLLQGFALGGAVGPTSAFLLEAASPADRGLYSSLQFASQGIAVLLGGLVGTILANLLGDASLAAWGWRVAFGLGALVLPFSLYLRKALPDTVEHARSDGSPAPIDSSLGAQARIIVLGFLMLASATIAIYTLTYMTTFALTTLHLKANISFAATVVLGLCNTLFSVPGGWLSDRFGRKPQMLWPRILLLVAIYPCFSVLVQHPDAVTLLTATAVITALNALSASAAFTALAEAVPARMRSQVLSVTYALAIAGFGGTTQPIIAWLIHITGAMAPAWYLTAATAVGLVAMLAMPETLPSKVKVSRPRAV